MERVLGKSFPVLDHGFVRVVDYMGDDAAIVQAARVSYGEGTKTVRTDEGLIRYLMRNYHSTPFEMCEVKLHVKLPVFVARQWIRHRTANVNEISARYSVLDNEFYIPDTIQAQSVTNKQGRGADIPGGKVREMLSGDLAYSKYDEMLKLGVSREIARMKLPSNVYTQWYWKTDLHNLFNFLYLRADDKAQLEIREYAYVISDIVSEWVPTAYKAFYDYKINTVRISKDKIGGYVVKEDVLT